MMEQEWLHAFDPGPMLEFLKGKVSDRKFRLFSCACYRRVWHKLHEVSKQAVEVAERFVDGKATSAELRNARQLVVSCPGGSEWLAIRGTAESHPLGTEWLAIRKASGYSAGMAAHSAASKSSWTRDGGQAPELFVSECRCQSFLVREIFGNPFRPVSFNPAWLTWHDGLLVSMAQKMYDSRDFSDMPVLADALEEAGCTNQAILDHCRSGGEHVRGCWVVDSILGRS